MADLEKIEQIKAMIDALSFEFYVRTVAVNSLMLCELREAIEKKRKEISAPWYMKFYRRILRQLSVTK